MNLCLKSKNTQAITSLEEIVREPNSSYELSPIYTISRTNQSWRDPLLVKTWQTTFPSLFDHQKEPASINTSTRSKVLTMESLPTSHDFHDVLPSRVGNVVE